VRKPRLPQIAKRIRDLLLTDERVFETGVTSISRTYVFGQHERFFTFKFGGREYRLTLTDCSALAEQRALDDRYYD